ncbi:MAG TPA: hypothetical protein PLI43_14665 [Albidovulum sp.]|uniref:hypothetical protein n=1 Tax=Albidovulum sp. TaxID=1872424 RepID=UPI002C17AD94|nr:hypothetical protein [Albidovulum sp.]
MNEVKDVCAAAAFLLLSQPALGNTVVTFQTPPGRLDSVTASNGFANGIWSEAGFSVAWGYEEYSDVTEAIIGFTFLSDCRGGCFGNGTSLKFTRQDGQPFSLRSIGIRSTATSAIGEASFTPFDANGNLDYSNMVLEQMEVVYDNLTFDVTRAGTTQRIFASSFYDTGFWSQAGSNVPVDNDGLLTFGGGMRAALSNAESIEISVGFGRSFLDIVQQSRDFSQLNSIFSLAPSDCIWNCVVDGLGVFGFSVDFGNYQNWGSAVATGSYTFDVGPAPVPLPASGLTLLGALSALSLSALRRSRKR